MEKPEAEKGCSSEDSCQLNRNRSFKSKQLVRSQAIREAQSPPRSASPADDAVTSNESVVTAVTVKSERPADSAESSHGSGRCSVNSDEELRRKQPVEIQITQGAWDIESNSEQRNRTRRWLGHKYSSRDLLSYSPRIACVCGACGACPHCRGRRRQQMCPTKQDSGIVCSDDCPDCSDSEQNGTPNPEVARKTDSLEVDDRTSYCRCAERRDKPKSISLSRTDSEERSDPSGPELVNFIKNTLNKNGRDRVTLLKIEKELHALVTDPGRCIVRFPVMTSYGRMLVHRCAALFQLSHHLDQNNKTAVLVSKSGTCGGRLPCTSFRQWCTDSFPTSPPHQPDPTHAKSILKRDTHSLDETGVGAMSAARSKSLEQREKDYERVRRRIFSTDNCNQDESQWPWLNTGPVKLLTPEAGRNKLLKVQSLEGSAGASGSTAARRGAVAKSHSFGGYSGEPAQAQHRRLLSRQGDLASSSWRLSPSSSGYRTLSLHSTDSVTPSPTGGASPEPASITQPATALVWAVTDLAAVPPGALVIHPQTGRVLTNADGSVYHFDPSNPPVLYLDYGNQEEPQDQKSDLRRGRLEKQNSFIDNECECQPSEESSKCCCHCRRHDVQQTSADKITTQPKSTQNPPSPSKNRYEEATTVTDTTNHIAQYDTTANQKPAAEEPANQRQSYEVPATNQRQTFQTKYEPANQKPAEVRTFEIQRPSSYDPTNQRPSSYDPTNQRAVNDTANQRGVKLANQETQEVQYVIQQGYPQGFRQDEVTSPHVAGHTFVQHDVSAMQAMAQAKVTPVLADPNLRPMSLGNMMYTSSVPQTYPSATTYPFLNHCRMDQQPQPLYQPLMHVEEPKQLAPSPHTDNTFRIDPSYPYAADYASCGACEVPQPRPYNVNVYGQTEVPTVLPQYPVAHNNIMLQPYPYQTPLEWNVGSVGSVGSVGGVGLQPLVPLPAQPKLYVHELYPMLQYPSVYPQYNVLYPQMVQTPYPGCATGVAGVANVASVAGVAGVASVASVAGLTSVAQASEVRRSSLTQRHVKRSSISGSSRNTPLQTPPDEKKVPYEVPSLDTKERESREPPKEIPRQNSNEIQQKIQQIKEQMAQLNTRDRGRSDWRRRNSGGGILGSYPVGNYNGRIYGRAANDETQLTSDARAIVNSIRNMQAKNYHQDNRRTDYNHYRNDRDKPDYRRRPDLERQNTMPETRTDGPTDEDRRANVRNRVPVPFQYRPPYLLRQMSPGTWCRRSPGPIHPGMNHPRRPHPDKWNGRR